MKRFSLLLLLCIAFLACHRKKTVKLDQDAEYHRYLYYDSLARVNTDSAFNFYYQASVSLIDSAYIGMSYQSMATIQQLTEDYSGSNESAIKAIAFFNEQKKSFRSYVSYNYNLLGSNCLNLLRFNDAFRYYDLAIQYADTATAAVYQNNKGVAYEKTGQYDLAITIFSEALQNSRNDTVNYARVLSNLGRTKWLKDSTYNPLPELWESLRLREQRNIPLELVASYGHLSNYYTNRRSDSAFYYAKKMLELAKQIHRPNDEEEALQKLVMLSSGNQHNNYLLRYISFRDSLKIARSNAINQFADIRFNFEAARANNLVLEKDNSQKRYRIIRQIFIIYGILFLFIASGLLSVAWYRKRKRIQDLQTKNAIRESELKTSQKVHDVVANGLYRILNELEHKENIDKAPLLDTIEQLYEQSRDISYEPHSTTGTETKRLKDMLLSFASTNTRILLAGITDKSWLQLSAATRKELEFVLQELMVNMKKHSGAKNVLVRFAMDKPYLKVHYQDDGSGMSPGTEYGNGLRNTGTRIKNMGGTITFDGNNGFKADIVIPI